jgi:DNA-binding MarR family transcriptional regulator
VVNEDPRQAGQPGDAVTRAWTLMRRFVEAHNRHGELAEALGFRLGGGRGKFLFQLHERPMTLSELAQANSLDAPYVTLIVDKLESQGLVQRQPHPGDRRRKLVTLTPAGHRAIATADEILFRPPAVMGTLPDRELKQLTELLIRILDADEAGGG